MASSSSLELVTTENNVEKVRRRVKSNLQDIKFVMTGDEKALYDKV